MPHLAVIGRNLCSDPWEKMSGSEHFSVQFDAGDPVELAAIRNPRSLRFIRRDGVWRESKIKVSGSGHFSQRNTELVARPECRSFVRKSGHDVPKKSMVPSVFTTHDSGRSGWLAQIYPASL
jgi:hypothetical protein